MRAAVIRTQALICGILSFVVLVNYGVWIWLATKIKSKKLKIAGIMCGVIMLVLWISLAFVPHTYFGIVGQILVLFILGFTFAPCVVNLAFLGEFVRCQNLFGEIDLYGIQIDNLESQDMEKVEINADPKYQKTSKRLFGEKSEDVLKAIAYIKMSKEVAKRKEQELKVQRKEEEKRKAEENRRRQEAERLAAIEAERKKAEAEIAKAESKKIEVELAKAEAEKLRLQNEKIEKEKQQRAADAERMKAEAEKAKAEAEKLKAEAEKMKQNRSDNIYGTMNSRETAAVPRGNIDVNSCTEEELSLLPGIGIILAKKAIQIRREKGQFNSVDEFVSMVGVRENHVEFLKDKLICVPVNNAKVDNINKFGRKIDF